MRAARLHGKQDLRIEDIPAASLSAGEVRVQIEASLTCGTDLKVWRRGYHARMLTPPSLFGHEFAGIIREVHPQTPGWKVGDRVVAANSAPCGQCRACRRGQEHLCGDLQFLNGAYAESIVVPERIVRTNLLRLAPETAFRDAALVEPLACVVQGLNDLRFQSGERLLVIGCGPIGLMAAILAQAMGGRATVVGRGGVRLGAARKLGIAEVLEMETHEDVEWAVKSQSTDREFDAVFEAVGKPSTWAAAARLVRPGGRVNWFGGCPADTTVALDTSLVHYSALTLLASFHHRPVTVRRALEWIETGAVGAEHLVTAEAPLSELPEVFQAMDRGGAAAKTLIDVRR
jgi:L-iditol 2-dehydrogenase